jgi:hypothetical protein
VLDERIYPTIAFSTIANSSCDDNYDGQIEVTAVTASGPGANYDFVWTDDPDNIGGPQYVVSDLLNDSGPNTTLDTDLVGAGDYVIRVTNLGTNCFADGEVEVFDNTIEMGIATVGVTNVDICSNLIDNTSGENGTATIANIDVTLDGANNRRSRFVYTWDNNSNFSSPLPADGASPNDFSISNLDFDT